MGERWVCGGGRVEPVLALYRACFGSLGAISGSRRGSTKVAQRVSAKPASGLTCATPCLRITLRAALVIVMAHLKIEFILSSSYSPAGLELSARQVSRMTYS